MVQLKDIFSKLTPHLHFSDNLMNIEIGDYEFDKVKKTGEFSYEYSNSKNPNVKLRFRDDFPIRIVLMEKKNGVIYGTTWSATSSINWTEEVGGPRDYFDR